MWQITNTRWWQKDSTTSSSSAWLTTRMPSATDSVAGSRRTENVNIVTHHKHPLMVERNSTASSFTVLTLKELSASTRSSTLTAATRVILQLGKHPLTVTGQLKVVWKSDGGKVVRQPRCWQGRCQSQLLSTSCATLCSWNTANPTQVNLWPLFRPYT